VEVNGPFPCFKKDTKILTNKGYIPIQDLKKGDLIKTLKHNLKPIVLIGKREINHYALKDRIKDQLYKCDKDNFPEILEPLIITGCHSILVDNFVS
jgi:intein/homing endonuclease